MKPFTETEHLALLEQSRAYNSLVGITGLLLSKNGNFMQMLEGSEKSVRELMGKIERDPRHKGIIILIIGNADTRQFPDWKMGFKNLHLKKENAPAAYSEFLNVPLNSQEFISDPTKCQRLLMSFKLH